MGQKIPYSGYFWARTWKKMYCFVWNQHPQVCQFAKFGKKKMMSKIVSKNVLFGQFLGYYFKKILSYSKSAPSNLSNCKYFQKTIAIFQISTLKVVNFANFGKKQSCWNLCPKLRYLGIFWARTFKKNCNIWNQHNRICLIAKFSKNYCDKKWKCLNLGQKMPYLGMSSANIFKKYWDIWNLHPQICLTAKYSKTYCHIWNQHPRICQFAKFSDRGIGSKIVTKNTLFGYFPGNYI